ncbi:NinE family protein [Salmonella enterica subsp. enterica serovar Livingstone]|nr:NinE family protein [Salmonella enterica subsp. enterica serovar Livingstone]EEM0310019.1 NinE family protein [Salmonella enterica subsp. enterica serovar Livingstone]EEN6232718.1 NinE family protein [Salmonella enterica subsp. enterica serovar Rissen]
MSRCQRRRRTYGRQRRSITDIICENCKYLPTKRSRNKPKPIPTESQVKTFDYVYGLLQSKWNRMRKTR